MKESLRDIIARGHRTSRDARHAETRGKTRKNAGKCVETQRNSLVCDGRVGDGGSPAEFYPVTHDALGPSCHCLRCLEAAGVNVSVPSPPTGPINAQLQEEEIEPGLLMLDPEEVPARWGCGEGSGSVSSSSSSLSSSFNIDTAPPMQSTSQGWPAAGGAPRWELPPPP